MKRHIALLRIALIALMVFTAGIKASAQGPGIERIRSLKIAYITDKLNLSSPEAEKFWPVYNKYDNELMIVRMDYMKKHQPAGFGRRKRIEAQQYIENDLDFQEEVLHIKKKYKDEFLKVISPEKLADLYAAEQEFRRMLIRRLKNGPR
jgi:hypothetical protein